MKYRFVDKETGVYVDSFTSNSLRPCAENSQDVEELKISISAKTIQRGRFDQNHTSLDDFYVNFGWFTVIVSWKINKKYGIEYRGWSV